jgi:CubicO group peptidase (beta-lactamase class C family)
MKKLLRRFSFLLLVALTCPGCDAAVDSNGHPGLRELMEAGNIPGLQLARVEEGELAETIALGLKNADETHEVTQATIFEAASLSKPVTAYVAFRLVDRGELDLDEPLWNLLEYPRLQHDERAREITPRMVLSHTTGLPNWGGTPLELINDPGQEWGYSGEGFVYLQKAMEKLTGRSLQEMAEVEVFGPLGMDATSFEWRDAYDSLKATGHDVLGRPVSGLRKPDEANAAASLHTTAGDYGRFLGGVLRGEGLSESSHAAMIEAASDANTRGPEETHAHVAWGLGWGVQETDRGRSIWHWGDNGVFRAFVIGYPAQGDGLVYFTNSEAGLTITETLLGRFFQDTHWAPRWLEYPRWDDEELQIDLALRRAFLRSYAEGTAMLDSLSVNVSLDVTEHVPSLVDFLANEGEVESALRLAEEAVEEEADDAQRRMLLADMQTRAGLFSEALESYRRALDLGGDPGDVEPRMAWLEEGLDATLEAPLTPTEMEAYAGRYGPRRIRVEDGKLLYSRDEGPETVLTPLSRVLFALESTSSFRLRFERGSSGTFEKIYGLYSDGRVDESVRDRSPRR